jgi:protein gp37
VADETAIGWTDKTFNPWLGCSRVSPACAHCYADTLARNRMGLHLWGDDAPRKLTSDSNWRKPLTWNRRSPEEHGHPTRVFCASMADVFEDRPELAPWRARLFALIEEMPYLDWQLLTKRPENALRMAAWDGAWPVNVWLGVSIENARYTWRADVLREIPAAVRFISAKPLLGSLFDGSGVATPASGEGVTESPSLETGSRPDARSRRAPLNLAGTSWIITGGESGANHRPLNLDHVRELRDACLAQCEDCQALGSHVSPDWQPGFEDDALGALHPPNRVLPQTTRGQDTEERRQAPRRSRVERDADGAGGSVTARETRLRERIDTLLDRCDELAQTVERLVHQNARLRTDTVTGQRAADIANLRRSRDLWRRRARDAEAMLASIHAGRRRSPRREYADTGARDSSGRFTSPAGREGAAT